MDVCHHLQSIALQVQYCIYVCMYVKKCSQYRCMCVNNFFHNLVFHTAFTHAMKIFVQKN